MDTKPNDFYAARVKVSLTEYQFLDQEGVTEKWPVFD